MKSNEKSKEENIYKYESIVAHPTDSMKVHSLAPTLQPPHLRYSTGVDTGETRKKIWPSIFTSIDVSQ